MQGNSAQAYYYDRCDYDTHALAVKHGEADGWTCWRHDSQHSLEFRAQTACPLYCTGELVTYVPVKVVKSAMQLKYERERDFYSLTTAEYNAKYKVVSRPYVIPQQCYIMALASLDRVVPTTIESSVLIDEGFTTVSEGLSTPCRSEVLGASAVDWINSPSDKIVGGMRRRPKGKQRIRKVRGDRVPKPFGVSPVNETILTTRFGFNMVNATGAIPYSYYYANLTNPIIANGGSATNVPFWTANTSAYRKFTVLGGSIKAKFSNTETSVVQPYLSVSVNSLLPQTALNAAAIFENPNTVTTELSINTGTPSCTLRRAWNKFRTTGFQDRGVEDAYVGLTDGSSPPSDNVYGIFGVYMGAPIPSVVGVLVQITIKFRVRFLEMQTPIN